KVTIVEVLPQLLPLEDEEVAKEFTRIFKKKGIEVYADAKVDAAEIHDGGVKVTVTAKGKQQVFDVEVVLSATGRRAVTENRDLEGAHPRRVRRPGEVRHRVKVRRAPGRAHRRPQGDGADRRGVRRARTRSDQRVDRQDHPRPSDALRGADGGGGRRARALHP